VSTPVLAPLAGQLMAIGEVPDPVFAAEMVGPGVAVDPDAVGGPVTVVSPIAGTVVKVHPHAFVVLGPDGVGVLVHLGLDTVRLEGRGFEVLTEQGGTVAAGDPMISWDVAVTLGEGLSAVVPVVAMDQPKGLVPAPESGRRVAAGDLLYDVSARRPTPDR
jgi:PTS system glucose-specific IIA component